MVIKLNKSVINIFRFIFLNIIKNSLGIARSKIITIFLGPSGIGILGQFLHFDGIQSRFTTFGITASLINTYNRAKKENLDTFPLVFANLVIVLVANMINITIIILGVQFFAKLIYNDINMSVLIYLGLFLNIVFTSAIFFEQIVQAKQNFDKLYKGRLYAISVALLLIFPFIYYFGIIGVILDLILLYAISTMYFFFHLRIYSFLNYGLIVRIISSLNLQTFKIVLEVAGIDVLRSIIIYGSLLGVRIFIIHNLSLEDAGFFHSIVSISNYTNLLLEGFMVSYFPIIGSSNSSENSTNTLNSYFKVLIYILYPIILILILLSSYILTLFFSSEFTHMSYYLNLLLLTKVIYMINFFFTITLLAKNFLKKFIFIEAIRGVVLITASLYFINLFGLGGAVYSIILTEILILVVVLYQVNDLPFIKIKVSSISDVIVVLINISVSVLIPVGYAYKIPFIILSSILLLNYKSLIKTILDLRNQYENTPNNI
jgi:O-antigen/teichoic acid export membrane protein